MIEHTSGNEGLPFYGAQEAMQILDVSEKTMWDITRNGLLLMMRFEGLRAPRNNQYYAAPYINAVRNQIDSTGNNVDEALRDVAYASGGQVNAIVDAFTDQVEHSVGLGGMPRSRLMETFGWDRYDLLDAHGVSNESSAAEILSRVSWHHAILGEVELLNASQVVLDELSVTPKTLSSAAHDGRILAQQISNGQKKRKSNIRYPALVVRFEKDYADNKDIYPTKGLRSVDPEKLSSAHELDRLILARFGASLYRASNEAGYLSVRNAARLLKVTGTTLRSYDFYEAKSGLQRSELLNHVVWSRRPTEKPLASDIFNDLFNDQWHYLNVDHTLK